MVIPNIHNKYKELTKAEQKIANFIISSPHDVLHMTVGELAEKCFVAGSAVIRFCKDIGVGGFSALKIALAKEISQDEVKTPAFKENDNVENVFKNVFSSGINALSDTLKMIDFSEAEKIAKSFLEAERIFIFGVGTSSTVALDASYRFSQLGLSAHAYTDVLFMNVMASNMTKNDVAFCISHSGSTKVTVGAMRNAKAAGATTVCLTSFKGSQLYKESDMGICVYADEENYPVEAVSARIGHMCVVDALMMTLGTMKFGSVEKYINVRNKVLEEIRY